MFHGEYSKASCLGREGVGGVESLPSTVDRTEYFVGLLIYATAPLMNSCLTSLAHPFSPDRSASIHPLEQ